MARSSQLKFYDLDTNTAFNPFVFIPIYQQLASMREEVLYVIFLGLTKAYDALDRSRTLEILKGYGVGDRVRRLLATYWERTTVVARAGQYYGTGFKGD